MENTGAFDKVELDLGDVREIAQVYINGGDAGFKLWKPFSFDLTGLVKEGGNDIEVHVTNSLANRYDQAGLASGLLGPVSVKTYSCTT